MYIHISWELKIHHMGRRALGMTYYHKKVISFSKRTLYYDTLVINRDTLLHEIAHVLAGHSHGHDAHWKGKCLITGASPTRCCSNSKVEKQWFLICETENCYKRKYN